MRVRPSFEPHPGEVRRVDTSFESQTTNVDGRRIESKTRQGPDATNQPQRHAYKQSGASRRLYSTLLRPRDGADVGVWSDQFEHDVQEIVDHTGWRPPDAIRARVGATVYRPDGTPITDLDSIAMRGRRLMLVSCKAMAFTIPVVGGVHNAVREIAAKVHDATREWSEKLDEIRAHPSCLGVELPDDVQIDGFIVLPATPFATEPQCYREVLPGVPYVLSSSELEAALGR